MHFLRCSRDKCYHGTVGRDKIIAQMIGLPEVDGKKIPSNSSMNTPSIRSLTFSKTLRGLRSKSRRSIWSAVVDDINAHASDLTEILTLAQKQDVKIMFASIGFESFCDRLLQYFCKGITVADIVECVETLRPPERQVWESPSLPAR